MAVSGRDVARAGHAPGRPTTDTWVALDDAGGRLSFDSAYTVRMTNRRIAMSPGVALLISCSIAVTACRTGTPVIDTGPKPPTAEGTIAGKVTTEGNAPVVSRVVRAIAADGTRHEVTTNSAGTYTLKVPPGKYKLEVELRDGERLVKQPGETEINRSDLDPGRNFVIGVGR